MTPKPEKINVAVVQAAPVLFDKHAGIQKACELLKETTGSQLVLFPEAYIPGYPRGLSFGTVVGSRNQTGRELWQLYWENSIDVPGPETKILGKAAAAHKTYLTIGVTQRDPSGSLYCSLLYFGPDGSLLGTHRKLKPTAAERIIWGEGSSLTTIDTPFGRIGGLICWENYMPLARTALYMQNLSLYLAPTADARDSWTASMIHIALESRCFLLSCNQYVEKKMYPASLPGIDELDSQPEIMCNGGSLIVSPLGEILAGPLRNSEGILRAQLDMSETIRGKLDFDVVGHYARPDIFQLHVTTD